ncbi:hypothetical protein ARMGADRAFT_1033961 [Armillaria gallica]|uniref:Uncharacterized protein n=1 Tax=Armillaria gallica TaxID=47427 RepID=A0A2H3DHS5_ARMGA|nr:hypothetical protein ARMGADRAFT_1033961 [Armillaria gallica]
MPSQRAPDIYASMLKPHGHGYALLCPDTPSNHPLGIQFGDLGYLDDKGGFVYLFNVCKAANDPVNVNRTPPDFVQLTGIDGIADILIRRRLFRNNETIHAVAGRKKSIGANVSVTTSFVPAALGSGFEFTSAGTQAALLVLPDGATSYTCRRPSMMEHHATNYAHSWYKYFNGPGQSRQIPNGMLYLVTGCIKCRSWANACYSHDVESRAVSLNLSIASGGANASGTPYCKWVVQSDSPVHRRSHPEPPTLVPAPASTPALVAATTLRRDPNPPNLPEATENQTVFLHGISMILNRGQVILKCY